MFRTIKIFLVVVVIAGATKGCSEQEASMPEASSIDFKEVALQFTKALTDRDYLKAYAMMSTEYRNQANVDQLQSEFEAIVPPDWGTMGPIEIGATLEDWPDRQPSDFGWVYVSIGGDVYSEGVTVVVMSENGDARIRKVEFGRP